MSNSTAEQITINDMNEAIAILDGWHLIKGDPNHKCKFCFAGDEPCTPAMDRFIKDGITMYYNELRYHTSWDSLMPVLQKIEDMEWCVRIENWPKKFPTPYKEKYSVWMWQDPEDCPEIQTNSDSKIEAVHKAVYEVAKRLQSLTP